MTCPSDVKVYHKFTIEEVRAIYRLFEREWVSRDDDEVWQVTQRISRIVKEDELATRDSQSTR